MLLTKERLYAIDQLNGEGRQQSFAAALLLEYVVKRLFPNAEHPLEIAIAQGGKPYLAKEPDIHFNLSHSGEWPSAPSAAVRRVDIQHCDEGRRDVASRFFHREETAIWISRRSSAETRAFTVSGHSRRALSRRPAAVSTCRSARSGWTIRRGRPQIDCGNIEGQYKLFELAFPADKAYRLAVCVRDLSESEPHLMIL